MAEFGLIKSFDIDNGELDDSSKQECFVLGYELAELDKLLELPIPICKPVHSKNAIRIIKSCEQAKRKYKLNWLANDQSEDWMQLEVKGIFDENNERKFT